MPSSGIPSYSPASETWVDFPCFHLSVQVVILEKQYWKLLEVPPQDPGEDNVDYVARVVDLLEGAPAQQPSGIGALLGAVAIRSESRLDGTLYDAIRSEPCPL